MNNQLFFRYISFCVLITWLTIRLLSVDSFAVEVSAPGTWFDQDKYHLSSEPDGGESWHENFGLLINGFYHDPGESVSETYYQPTYNVTLPDGSCWMASASNMVTHRQGTLRYHSWAYSDGIVGDFVHPWGDNSYTTYTFDDGGLQHYCLEAEGLPWTVMAEDSLRFDWVEPMEYIAACLKAGSPVGIGLFIGGDASEADSIYGHALTVYAVNTENNTFTIADSDEDSGGNNFKMLSYTDRSGSGDIQIISSDAYWNWDLRYICSFDDIGWWTSASGSWHSAANWASAHAPTTDQDVYLTQSNIGSITINNSANARNLYVSSPGSVSLQAGGLLSTSNQYIGESGTVTFFHSGGTNSVSGDLFLGHSPESLGVYGLSGNGRLSTTGNQYIGYEGKGTIKQTGGTNSVGAHISLGELVGSEGTYELSGTAQLSSEYSQYIGALGTGKFIQTGGINSVGHWLCLGRESGSNGTYELSNGGQLSVGKDQHIGWEGTGVFKNVAGTNSVSGNLKLGWSSSSSGTYELSDDGQLSSANSQYVGYGGTGIFKQTGGNNSVGGNLYVGYRWCANGTYNLSDGSLSASTVYIAYEGTGQFVWTGGSLEVDTIKINSPGTMVVDHSWAFDGALNVNGGTLLVTTLGIEAASGTAALNINSARSEISVSEKLRFGANSTLVCVDGAKIHMTGSTFENESTNPDALSGLENLTMIFEGGGADLDLFEIAGEDVGAVFDGFENNFALSTLQIGGNAGIGKLQLIDLFDNQPSWQDGEALYVDNLILHEGSYLDLNGLNLYYQTFTDLGGTIELNGGVLSAVPEPSCLTLLLACSVFLLTRLGFYRRR